MTVDPEADNVRQCIINYLANAHKTQGNTCCALLEVVDNVVHHASGPGPDTNTDMWVVRKAISKLRHEGKVVMSSRPIPLIALKHLMENDKFVYMALQHHSHSNLAYGRGCKISSYNAPEAITHALLKVFREPGSVLAMYSEAQHMDYFRKVATEIAASNNNRVAIIERHNSSYTMQYVEPLIKKEAPLLAFVHDVDSMNTTELYQIIMQLPTNDVKLVFVVEDVCMSRDASFVADLCKSRMVGYIALDEKCKEVSVSDADRYGMYAFIDDLRNSRPCTWLRNTSLVESHGPEDLVYTEMISDETLWGYATHANTPVIVCCDALDGIYSSHMEHNSTDLWIVTDMEQLATQVTKLVSSCDEVQLCIMKTFGQIPVTDWYKIVVKLPPTRLHIVATQEACYKQFCSTLLPMPYTCLRKFLAQNSHEYQE